MDGTNVLGSIEIGLIGGKNSEHATHDTKRVHGRHATPGHHRLCLGLPDGHGGGQPWWADWVGRCVRQDRPVEHLPDVHFCGNPHLCWPPLPHQPVRSQPHRSPGCRLPWRLLCLNCHCHLHHGRRVRCSSRL